MDDALAPPRCNVYVILYLPSDNDPEVFGPYPTAQRGAQALRYLSGSAGTAIDLTHAGALATIDIWIANERNRYQLLLVGSPDQLEIHGDIIRSEVAEGEVKVETPDPLHLEKGAGLLGG